MMNFKKNWRQKMEKEQINRRQISKISSNVNISLRHTSDEEIVEYYLECHGGNQQYEETIDQWIQRMLDLLGPDDCKFLVRSVMPHLKGMWMGGGNYLWISKTSNAIRFSWGQVAAKCTNHSKLEAIRIINDKEAVDSKGTIIPILPFKPIEEVMAEEASPLDEMGAEDLAQVDTAAAPVNPHLTGPYCPFQGGW